VIEDDFEDPIDPMGGEWLEALSDHLVLEVINEGEDRTPSGLLIPKSAAQPKQGYRRFRVLAAGPMCTDDRVSEFPEQSVEPGDTVLAPIDELGYYREAGHVYYVAHYEMIAAVIRDPLE